MALDDEPEPDWADTWREVGAHYWDGTNTRDKLKMGAGVAAAATLGGPVSAAAGVGALGTAAAGFGGWAAADAAGIAVGKVQEKRNGESNLLRYHDEGHFFPRNGSSRAKFPAMVGGHLFGGFGLLGGGMAAMINPGLAGLTTGAAMAGTFTAAGLVGGYAYGDLKATVTNTFANIDEKFIYGDQEARGPIARVRDGVVGARDRIRDGLAGARDSLLDRDQPTDPAPTKEAVEVSGKRDEVREERLEPEEERDPPEKAEEERDPPEKSKAEERDPPEESKAAENGI